MHEAYMWVKFLHYLGAVAWLGWALLAPVWLGLGLRCNEARTLDAMRGRVTWLTLLCIGGGAALLAATGWPMAQTLSPEAFTLLWLYNGTFLAASVTLAWLLVLLPLYRKLLAARELGGTHPPRLELAWRVLAIAVALLALAVLWLMTVRPA